MSPDPMLPPGIFYPPHEETDKILEEVIFGLMHQTGEPSLWKQSNTPGYHAYRFRWEGGLRLAGPLVIRLTVQSDGSGTAAIKIWQSVKVEPPPGTIFHYPKYEKRLVSDYTKTIGKRNVDKFLRQLEKTNFWNLPVQDNRLGCDGHSCDWEGVKDGKFHFVMRWVPEEKDFIEMGLVLLRICNLYKNWNRAVQGVDCKPGMLLRLVLAIIIPPYILWCRVTKRWPKSPL